MTLPAPGRRYPDLSDVFPSAGRMQRAARDLSGLVAEGATDERRWLRHGAWRADEFPLRRDFVHGTPDGPDRYDFVQVGGDVVRRRPDQFHSPPVRLVVGLGPLESRQE